MKTKIVLLFVTIITAVMFNSCKKNGDATQPDSEVQSAVDYGICEREFTQMGPTSTNLTIKTKGCPTGRLFGVEQILSTCDTLTKIAGDTLWASGGHIDPTYQYDFGACNANTFDGQTRTGKWQITFRDGGWAHVGSKMVIKLLGYSTSMVSYTCDSIVFKNDKVTNGVHTFTIDIVNAKCATATWTVSYNSSKVIKVDTKNNLNPADDDVTVVSGTANGVNREGRSFTVTISNLFKPASCKYITTGIITITPNGLKTRTINFGSGTCDDDATMTVDGSTIPFKLQ